MIFYSHQTVAVASHITLEEVGQTMKQDWFSAGEQRSDAYLGVSKGRVPYGHGRKVITETTILLYLAQRFWLKPGTNGRCFPNGQASGIQRVSLCYRPRCPCTQSEAKDGPMMKTP